MGRIEEYRAELARLPEWEAYLKKNSGLPGARANLELVEAVGEEADPERLWRLSASSDEFLALCGTAGLGHLAVSDPVPVMSWLRELAADPRWRVREGVAIALQPLGRHSMPRLLAVMEKWLRSPDNDVAWVMTSNLSKARIGALGPGWVTKWRARATAQARVTALPAPDIAATKPYMAAPPAKPTTSAAAKKPAAKKPG